jgi:hypothetical protein
MESNRLPLRGVHMQRATPTGQQLLFGAFTSLSGQEEAPSTYFLYPCDRRTGPIVTSLSLSINLLRTLTEYTLRMSRIAKVLEFR